MHFTGNGTGSAMACAGPADVITFRHHVVGAKASGKRLPLGLDHDRYHQQEYTHDRSGRPDSPLRSLWSTDLNSVGQSPIHQSGCDAGGKFLGRNSQGILHGQKRTTHDREINADCEPDIPVGMEHHTSVGRLGVPLEGGRPQSES